MIQEQVLTGLTNENVIGYGAIGNGSNSVTLGNTSVTKTILNGNVGVGTTAPQSKLAVHGSTVVSQGIFNVTNSFFNKNTSTLAQATDSTSLNVKTSGTGEVTLQIKDKAGNIQLQSDTTKLTVKGDLVYNYTHGNAVISGASYTPTLTQNVPLKLTPSMTIKEADNMTIAGDTVTIWTGFSGDYTFKMFGNLASANNNDFVIQCRKNNVEVDTNDRYQGSTTGTSNYTPISFEWYLSGLVAGDDISFFIVNATNNDDPVIRGYKIIVDKMPEN
jgi:hypothetical protein